MSPRIDRLWYEIDAATEGFDKGILQSQQRLENFVNYAKGQPLVVFGAMGAAALATAYKAAEMAAQFETQMARINTAAQLPKPALDALGRSILDLSRSTGMPLSDLAKGMYDIVSSGIDASKAMVVLEAATKGAIGGMTSVATSVDALTSILNAYKDENLSAEKAQDQMFEAVNKGKITYEELAGSIGQVVGIAATLHISLDDLLGVITQLSLQGIRTSEAITGIRAAITNIIQPSEQFRNMFPELAAQFNEGRLKGEGFTQFLIDLNKAAKGNTQVLATLFGSVEGYKTVLAALQHDGQGVVAMQQDIATSTGAAAAATRTMTETAEQAHARLSASLIASLTEFGHTVLPEYNRGLKDSIALLTALSNILKGLPGGGEDAVVQQIRGLGSLAMYGQNERFKDVLSRDQVNELRNHVRDISLLVQSGSFDLEKLSTAEAKALDFVLEKTQQDYGYLGRYIEPVHQRLTQLLADRAQADQAQADLDRKAADARRSEAMGKVNQAVIEGTRSAREMLAPADQDQRYQTAVRIRRAGAAAIAAAEGELAKAARDAQAALAAGDDAALDKAKTAADAARSKIEDQRAAMKQANEEIYQYHTRVTQLVNEVTGQIGEMLGKATRSTVDDLTAELAKLDAQVQHVRDKGGVVDQAAVDRVHALYQGLIQVARESDATKQVLEQTSHPGQRGGTTADFEKLGRQDLQLRMELAGLDEKALGYADRRRDLEEQIRAIEQRRAELSAQNVEGAAKEMDRLAQMRELTSKLVRDQAQAIQGVVGASVQLGEAFGAVNQHIGDVVTSLTQIATSIGPLLDEIDKFNSGMTDSKGNPLATFGSVIAAAQPIIAGISAFMSVLGGNAADREAYRRTLQANTDAIAKLTRQVGEFGQVNIAGGQYDKIAQALQAVLDAKYSGNILKAPDQARDILAQFGLTMQDLKDLAQQLGITFNDQNIGQIIDSAKALAEAIQQNQLTQFAQTFTGQLQALQMEFQLFDITDPIEQLKKLRDLFDDPKFGAPALREALAGIDLSTPEGREAAKKAIQHLFELMQQGLLTPEMLGGLTPEQFAEMLQETKQLIDQADGATSGSGGYNTDRSITEVTGGHIAGLLTTSNVWLSQIADSTASMEQMLFEAIIKPIIAGKFDPLVGKVPHSDTHPSIPIDAFHILQSVAPALASNRAVVIAPPAIPSRVDTNGGAGGGGSGPLIGNLNLTVTVPPGTSPDDAHQIGQAIGESAGAAIVRAIQQDPTAHSPFRRLMASVNADALRLTGKQVMR